MCGCARVCVCERGTEREREREIERIKETIERLMCLCVLQAGGCAGMCVDLTLFPLDTIKTRLQSQQGFYKAGGFRGIYAGVPSAAVGSFPNGESHLYSLVAQCLIARRPVLCLMDILHGMIASTCKILFIVCISYLYCTF